MFIQFLCMYLLYGVWLIFFINYFFEKNSFLGKPEALTSPKYAAFTRSDYPKWNKTKMFFCGLFLLPIRGVAVPLLILFTFLELKLMTVIFSVKDYSQPQNPVFLKLCKWCLRINCRLILFFFGYYYIPKSVVKSEGSEYLEVVPETQDAIIISNHVSYIDIFYLLSQARNVCFVSNQLVRHYPLVGMVAEIIQCIFVDRKKKDSKINAIKNIEQRVEALKQSPKSKRPIYRFYIPKIVNRSLGSIA